MNIAKDWDGFIKKVDRFKKIETSEVIFGEETIRVDTFRSEADTEEEAMRILMDKIKIVLRRNKHIWVRIPPQIIKSEDGWYIGYARIAYG